MHILVTAGNTQAPIDDVRCVTNIFSGRTGANIAARAAERRHDVVLLTSHPEVVPTKIQQLAVRQYRLFDELRSQMVDNILTGHFDAIIHCAAVSDYLVAGIFSPDRLNVSHPMAGKIKSDEPELWLKLVRAPKLVDAIRREWQFRGVLVKFKLEVEITDERLLEVAENSRRQSGAELMVANTLEGAAHWAFLGPIESQYLKTSRLELPDRLIDAIENLHRRR